MSPSDIVDVTDEPSGMVLRAILEFGLEHQMIALLVVRSELGLSQSGETVLERLTPFLIDRREAEEWPGTKLHGGFARVSRFSLGRESASIICAATDHLYGWRQPDLPEDLCILRRNGDPWLITISHEEDCYFRMTSEEKARLLAEKPELEILF
jgi:hypothetical protein